MVTLTLLNSFPDQACRAGAAAVLALCLVGAQAQELNVDLREQVLMVPKQGAMFTTLLETTIYRPPGDGPFPLAVINHGKAHGDPRFQARFRPSGAVRFFLQRGYAVVVPMRQGFSKSEGSYIGGGCNVESNGDVQAQDVKGALDHITALAWADKSRILVAGQSHGGWTTLAFGTLSYPGVRGLVNFAGGLRQDNCAGWEATLARAGGAYGKATRVPSLWFYGDNDSYFSPDTFRPLYENYVAAGGQAELVAFGRFGRDAHTLFASRAGEVIWQPRVEAFMRSVGLPVEVTYPGLGAPSRMAIPPPSGFALLSDEEKIPYLKASGRDGYRAFLLKQLPRAFALSPSGAWGWAEMGDDPLARALANCNKSAKNQPCQLYAVDDQVVWVKE
jgi:dienelactone hydrolase